MNLPLQLQREEFRFLLVSTHKRPMELNWQNTANYSYSNKRVSLARNLGVLCGKGGLVVVDFDDPQAQAAMLPLLPKTFTVKTAGKGLLHLYYLMDEPTTIRINSTEETPRRLCDVQGPRTQVIAPGSYNATTGRFYTIELDIPIAQLTIADLRKAIKSAGFSEQTPAPAKIASRNVAQSGDGVIAEIKRRLSVPFMLTHYGIDTRKNPTMCPLGHQSSGQTCFSFTQEVFHCFHCDESGDAIMLLEKKEGCTRGEAIKRCADLAGVPLPEKYRDSTRAYAKQLFDTITGGNAHE